MKQRNRYILIFLAIILVTTLVEYNQDEPVDWTPGFSATHTKPYGLYALYRLLPSLFPSQTVEDVHISASEQFEQHFDDSGITYMLINDAVPLNAYDCNALVYFAQHGNTVFMASENFPDTLMQLLNIKNESYYNLPFYYLHDTVLHFNFCKSLRTSDSGYTIRNDYYTVVSYLDSFSNTRRRIATDAGGQAIAAEIQMGSGKIILCTLPYAFTNYYALKPDNAGFIVRIMQCLPQQKIWWDEYYKSNKEEVTPMRYVLREKGLRWAYYIAVSGLILFVIFMGRRRQRIIPENDPMRNTTLEFAETVGQVYFEKADHLNLAQKKIRYFFEYLRSRYFINASLEWKQNPAVFYTHLAGKTGKPEEEIKQLFRYIEFIEKTIEVSEQQLVALETMIEKFKTSKK